jgi:hypothetical protein
MVDHAPQGVLLRFEPDGHLVERVIETMRIEPAGAGALAVLGTASSDELVQSSDLISGHRA